MATGTAQPYRMLIDYRSGDMCAPQLDITEALNTEAKHSSKARRGSADDDGWTAGLRGRISKPLPRQSPRAAGSSSDAVGCAV